MRRKKRPTARTRIRLEFTVYPGAKREPVPMNCDRKITALRVLLRERFHGDGERLFADWATLCLRETEARELATVWSAGGA